MPFSPPLSAEEITREAAMMRAAAHSPTGANVPPLTGIRNDNEDRYDAYPSATAAAQAAAAGPTVTQRDRVLARSYRRRQRRLEEATAIASMAPEIAAHNAEEARENEAAVLGDDHLRAAESDRIAAENERLARVSQREQRFAREGQHVLHLGHHSDSLAPSPPAAAGRSSNSRRRDRDEEERGESATFHAERMG